MQGTLKYLHETLGESVKLIRDFGVKKIRVICDEWNPFEHTIDFSSVSPEDVTNKMQEFMDTDETLKNCLQYRTKKVEHVVDEESGDKEMRVFVSPITHVFDKEKYNEDLKRAKQPSNSFSYAIRSTGQKTFGQVFREHLEASLASEDNSKSNEVK